GVEVRETPEERRPRGPDRAPQEVSEFAAVEGGGVFCGECHDGCEGVGEWELLVRLEGPEVVVREEELVPCLEELLEQEGVAPREREDGLTASWEREPAEQRLDRRGGPQTDSGLVVEREAERHRSPLEALEECLLEALEVLARGRRREAVSE